MKKKPQVIITRHYKNGIINARSADDPWHYQANPGALIFDGEGRYVRCDLGLKDSDYHEGIEEGWKAGAAQERRILEEAVRRWIGTIPEGLRNALKQVRAEIEGE